MNWNAVRDAVEGLLIGFTIAGLAYGVLEGLTYLALGVDEEPAIHVYGEPFLYYDTIQLGIVSVILVPTIVVFGILPWISVWRGWYSEHEDG